MSKAMIGTAYLSGIKRMCRKTGTRGVSAVKNNILGCRFIDNHTDFDGCSIILCNESILGIVNAVDFALTSMGYNGETDSIFIYHTRSNAIPLPNCLMWEKADNSFFGHAGLRECHIRVKSECRDIMMVVPLGNYKDSDFLVIGGVIEK